MTANLLPPNWKWQTDDAAKDLQVGNNSATAIYTGRQIKEIMKEKLLLTQSPEVNVNTNIPQNATTPLHPVLPADTVEIPTVKTVMKQFPMDTPFPHTVMTMTMALSLQNQLQKLTES